MELITHKTRSFVALEKAKKKEVQEKRSKEKVVKFNTSNLLHIGLDSNFPTHLPTMIVS